jgi:hypothetical protein
MLHLHLAGNPGSPAPPPALREIKISKYIMDLPSLMKFMDLPSLMKFMDLPALMKFMDLPSLMKCLKMQI